MISAILLVSLYVIIFGFSSQDGEESGSLSKEISTICVEVIETISGQDWSQSMTQSLAEYFEHPIRKLAHFTEYALMGLLVWTILEQWMTKRRLKWGLAVSWVFISAAFDEFHQTFVPGRYGSPIDVLIDTFGGIFGMLICSIIIKIGKRIVDNRKNLGK